jgi:hypothetical protein
LFLAPQLALSQNPTREQKVRADKAKVESAGFWIYNDLPKAYALAKETGKPIVVSMRCIPCEECVKLDDDVVDADPVIRPLLEQFVCVRIVGTNGLDLDTFQYDTDQSFAMFMLNADKTIYGRFGTRSHRTDWIGDVSLDGLARALGGALELHAAYPANRMALAGKRGKPLEYPTPEQYPALKDDYTSQLNYSGDVVKSCIHCHQIGEARRDIYWSQGKPIPEELLYPFPHPKSVGLVLAPDERALIKSVIEGSPAAHATLQAGDHVLSMNGQPLLSMADVQWVLHHVPAAGGEVQMEVERAGKTLAATLKLDKNWRREDDTSWRVAAWEMRRIALGGLRLVTIDTAKRKSLGLEAGMALEVASVGMYGPHATAKNAGFQEGDVIVEFDGQTDFAKESDLFTHVNAHRRIGEQVTVRVQRGELVQILQFPIQK